VEEIVKLTLKSEPKEAVQSAPNPEGVQC
jgi:hypothetical protein